MGFSSQGSYLTEFSNRLKILEEFTTMFIQFNRLKSLLEKAFLSKGVLSKDSLKIAVELYTIYGILDSYLRVFGEEEKSKRVKKKDREEIEKKLEELEKVKRAFFISITTWERLYFEHQDSFIGNKDKIKKEVENILSLLETIVQKIAELNTYFGLFSQNKRISSSKEENEEEFYQSLGLTYN
jgi:hypothetical protein